MKKYFVEVFITFAEEDRRSFTHESYECESYEAAKNWTGECIRLDDVNSYKEGKKNPVRKQMKRGKYITVERMPHWSHLEVVVFKNGTDEVVEKWES